MKKYSKKKNIIISILVLIIIIITSIIIGINITKKDKELIKWYERQISKSNVNVHMNTEIKDLSELKEIDDGKGGKKQICQELSLEQRLNETQKVNNDNMNEQ